MTKQKESLIQKELRFLNAWMGGIAKFVAIIVAMSVILCVFAVPIWITMWLWSVLF